MLRCAAQVRAPARWMRTSQWPCRREAWHVSWQISSNAFSGTRTPPDVGLDQTRTAEQLRRAAKGLRPDAEGLLEIIHAASASVNSNV